MLKGVAHVQGNYSYPSSTNQFLDGVNGIWNQGFRTLKVYATGSYESRYPLQSSWSGTPTNLSQLVALTEYATAFEMDWDTIVLTTFTFANGDTNWWIVDWSEAKLQAEYTEIYNMSVYLLTTYAGTGKKFILQNWEGDWAYSDSFNPATIIPPRRADNYSAFLARRQKAVSDARRDVGCNGVNIQMAVEVNRPIDALHQTAVRRITNTVMPLLESDILSYSAYDSTIAIFGWGSSQAELEANIREYFPKALKAIKRSNPGKPIQIGEFGYPDNAIETPVWFDWDATIRLIYDICLENDVFCLIYWEVFSNELIQPGDIERGYWTIKPDGATSAAGIAMQNLP